jgi:hypothetical protein
METSAIHHTVAFRLEDSADAAAFWAGVDTLASIGGVQRFQTLRQVGSKNNFTHALSMYFESQAAYDGYSNHPEHVAFVEEVWKPNVAEFIELDYLPNDASNGEREDVAS